MSNVELEGAAPSSASSENHYVELLGVDYHIYHGRQHPRKADTAAAESDPPRLARRAAAPASASSSSAYVRHDVVMLDEQAKVYTSVEVEDGDDADSHPIFSSNCNPIVPFVLRSLGSKLPCASRRGDDFDEDATCEGAPRRLVFSSPVTYHCWNAFLLTVLPICTVLSMALVGTDRTVPHRTKTRDLIALWTASVSALLLLFLLLPRRVELYSDSTAAVVSYLFSHEFGNVVAAELLDDEEYTDEYETNRKSDMHKSREDDAGDGYHDLADSAAARGLWVTEPCSQRGRRQRPRILCGTNFASTVVLRRRDDPSGGGCGRWDVVVSPQDPRGLVDAVSRAAQAREDGARMRAQVCTV
jgi:hypothetical protein